MYVNFLMINPKMSSRANSTVLGEVVFGSDSERSSGITSASIPMDTPFVWFLRGHRELARRSNSPEERVRRLRVDRVQRCFEDRDPSTDRSTFAGFLERSRSTSSVGGDLGGETTAATSGSVSETRAVASRRSTGLERAESLLPSRPPTLSDRCSTASIAPVIRDIPQ